MKASHNAPSLPADGLARAPMRIGITIGLAQENESLWNNGIKQNALFLAKLFLHSPIGHSVTLVNTTRTPITASLAWDVKEFPTTSFEEAKDRLDILFELGGQIDEDQTRYLKMRGTHLVSYCCGPEYVQTMEAMIFGRRMFDTVFINQRYDEVWVIPQVAETTFHYLKVLRRRPTRRVPFIWDPLAIERAAASLPHQGQYRPTPTADQPRRLSIMEPNIDVLKFCFYPMLIAEEVYRKMPEKIGFLHVTNAEKMAKSSPEFTSMALQLDIVRAHKASFVGRFDTPRFLSEHTDIIISHQWGLALNYFYFDVCWQGYALVHNASLCHDMGYYYPENDVDIGATQLMKAITQHDGAWEAYRARQRSAIGRFLATDPALIAHYDAMLYEVKGREVVV